MLPETFNEWLSGIFFISPTGPGHAVPDGFSLHNTPITKIRVVFGDPEIRDLWMCGALEELSAPGSGTESVYLVTTRFPKTPVRLLTCRSHAHMIRFAALAYGVPDETVVPDPD